MDEFIHRELSAINTKLDQLMYIVPLVEKHDELIFGNNSEVGLLTRIDRIEQVAKQHKWIFSVALVGFINAVWEHVSQWFK
jgi:hypothetical protein